MQPRSYMSVAFAFLWQSPSISPLDSLQSRDLRLQHSRRRRVGGGGLDYRARLALARENTNSLTCTCDPALAGAFPARLLRSSTRGAGQESWSLRGRGCVPSWRTGNVGPLQHAANISHATAYHLQLWLGHVSAPRPALRAKSQVLPGGGASLREKPASDARPGHAICMAGLCGWPLQPWTDTWS